MNPEYNIQSLCLRYVVPFTFSESFEAAFAAVEGQKQWVRKTPSLIRGESDLYEYVRNEFCFEDEHSFPEIYKTGYEWLFQESEIIKNVSNHRILNMRYFDDLIDREVDFEIVNLGLILFRNNLGFIWYELRLHQEHMDSGQLIRFQNIIKELNRDVQDQKHISPCSLGEWISERLSFLNVHFIAERMSENMRVPDKAILFTYCSMDGECSGDDRLTKEKIVYYLANGYTESYYLSDEIVKDMKHPFANAIWYATQEGTVYAAWPGIDNQKAFNEQILKKVMTDYFTLFIKALYQSYSLLIYAQKIQNQIPAVNGKSLVEAVTSEISELHAEINLFLTKSMATSVSHIHHQSEFYVYIKRQLRIEEDVNSVSAGLNALDALKREQRHQEEENRIESEWKAEKERDRVEQMTREQREEAEKHRDNKIQSIMGLFAILGIFSALVDCFDFIGKFVTGGDWSTFSDTIRHWEIVGWVIIGIIGLLAIIFTAKSIIEAFKSRNSE